MASTKVQWSRRAPNAVLAAALLAFAGSGAARTSQISPANVTGATTGQQAVPTEQEAVRPADAKARDKAARQRLRQLLDRVATEAIPAPPAQRPSGQAEPASGSLRQVAPPRRDVPLRQRPAPDTRRPTRLDPVAPTGERPVEPPPTQVPDMSGPPPREIRPPIVRRPPPPRASQPPVVRNPTPPIVRAPPNAVSTLDPERPRDPRPSSPAPRVIRSPGAPAVTAPSIGTAALEPASEPSRDPVIVDPSPTLATEPEAASPAEPVAAPDAAPPLLSILAARGNWLLLALLIAAAAAALALQLRKRAMLGRTRAALGLSPSLDHSLGLCSGEGLVLAAPAMRIHSRLENGGSAWLPS